jgi:hypothetical protein
MHEFLGKYLINYLSLFRLFGLNLALLIPKHYRFKFQLDPGYTTESKLLNLTDEYLIYHVELSMLKSNMSNLASINEWDIFTLFQVLKKFNFGISKNN